MNNIYVQDVYGPNDIFALAYPKYIVESGTYWTALEPFLSAEEKINSFGGLECGWDYGAGCASQESTISAALTWNKLLRFVGFETDASPGTDGEISVAGSFGDHYIEIIVEADATTSVAYDLQRKQQFYELRMQAIKALGSVIDVAGEIWSASTSYTHGSITSQNVSGIGSLSGTTKDPYQFSHVNALIAQFARFVNTQENSTVNTAASVVSPQYSGGSTQITYLPAVLSR
jgi:hypothetical protein